jgi:hypothetical protein
MLRANAGAENAASTIKKYLVFMMVSVIPLEQTAPMSRKKITAGFHGEV